MFESECIPTLLRSRLAHSVHPFHVGAQSEVVVMVPPSEVACAGLLLARIKPRAIAAKLDGPTDPVLEPPAYRSKSAPALTRPVGLAGLEVKPARSNIQFRELAGPSARWASASHAEDDRPCERYPPRVFRSSCLMSKFQVMETYEDLKQHYSDLLDLLFALLAAVEEGRSPPTSPEELHYWGFALKIFKQSATLLRLSNVPSSESSVAKYKFVDFSSAMALSRSLLESYVRFVYLFVAGPVGPESELKQLLWELSDLVARQRFPADADWAKEQLQRDAERIDIVRDLMRANEVFTARPLPERDRLLKAQGALGVGRAGRRCAGDRTRTLVAELGCGAKLGTAACALARE